MDFTTLLLISNVLLLIIFAVGIWFVIRMNKQLDDMQHGDSNARDSLVVNLNDRVDTLNKNMSETMQKVTDSMLKQLNETTKQVDTRLHKTHTDWQQSARDIRKTMENNDKTIRDVTGKLSQLEEAHKRIFEVGKDISSLQEILRAPKLRGALGELFLGDLLAQTYPSERFVLQHRFKSGEAVDAVVHLRDGMMVSIDAKFPLESFKRILESEDDAIKKQSQKEFVASAKKRIDEIAEKYILADEGTLDFALMYVPAENVYYEMVVRGESDYGIIEYAYAKRVIPVSPNNLYVYLQTIALGLRGMQIEERAKDILADLSRLQTDFNKVTDSYEIMGKHLSSAMGRYEETSKLISRFGAKVEQIEDQVEDETPVAVGILEDEEEV